MPHARAVVLPLFVVALAQLAGRNYYSNSCGLAQQAAEGVRLRFRAVQLFSPQAQNMCPLRRRRVEKKQSKTERAVSRYYSYVQNVCLYS